MKFITAYIGSKVDHIVDFDSQQPQVIPTFLIQDRGETELLALYHAVGINTQKPKRNAEEQQNNRKYIILQTSDGENKAWITAIETQAETQSEDCYMTITIKLSERSDESRLDNDGLQRDGLKFLSDKSNKWPLVLTRRDKRPNLEPYCVKIVFELTLQTDDKPIIREIHLWVALPDSINDVVLDFGSEASQMAIFKRDMKQTLVGIKRLFPLMKKILRPNTQESEADVFLQQDLSNRNLFKSVFYVKKEFSTSEAGVPYPKFDERQEEQNPINQDLANISCGSTQAASQPPIPLVGKDIESISTIEQSKIDHAVNDTHHQPLIQMNGRQSTTSVELEKGGGVLRMLTKETEIEDGQFIQLPNVKISSFGGVMLPEITVDGRELTIGEYNNNYFYRASINRFIYCALKNVEKPCICLYILMPNVYSYQDICRHLKWIQEDISKMIDKFDGVKCVELSVISESDASLLGALSWLERPERGKPLLEGNYLILDAGKGTLDFSVLEYQSSPKQFLSRYRSGIIGAGNALTYAYFCGMLYDCLEALTVNEISEQQLRQYIYENILGLTPGGKAKGGGDTAHLHKLMQIVEDYKVAIGDPKYKVGSINLGTSDNDAVFLDVIFEKINDIMKQMVNDKDAQYKLLSNQAQRFIDDTVANITEKVAEKLRILKALDIGEIKGVIFAGRGFRHKAFKESIEKMLDKIFTTGTHLQEMKYLDEEYAADEKTICLFIRNAVQQGWYNNHMMCVPAVKTTMKSGGSKDSSPKGLLDRPTKLLRKLFSKSSLNNVLEDLIDIRQDEQMTQTPGNEEKNGMVKGFKLCFESSSDSIVIGGSFFPIPRSGQMDLFFINDKVLLRDRNQKAPHRLHEVLDNDVDLATSPFLFATLFPNVNPEATNKIILPERKQHDQEVNAQYQPAPQEDDFNQVASSTSSDHLPSSDVDDLFDKVNDLIND